MKPHQLRLRDFLWLTVLAAVLTLWGIDHWRAAQEIERLSLDWETPLRSVEAVAAGQGSYRKLDSPTQD